jgi:hypothetical protein
MKFISFGARSLNILAYILLFINFKPFTLLTLAQCLILFIISEFLHSVFHEIGHLLAGKFTGYHLLFFQIGFLGISEAGQGTGLKISKRRDFNYQCAMIPQNDTNNLLILYNAGGILMNLAANIIFIFLIQSDIVNASIILIPLIFAGNNKLLANAIPYARNNLINDMKIITILINSRTAQHDYVQYLSMYEKKFRGIQVGKYYPTKPDAAERYDSFFAKAASQLADDG